jgi:Ser/Thr protein kinase RdoA (MazF antagonist)
MEPIDLDSLYAALARYDLPAPLDIEPRADQGVNNLNLRIRAGTQILRCKIFTDAHPEEALRYEQQLLQALAQSDLSFALPVPLADRHGETLQRTPLGWLALIPDLPGANLDPSDLGQVTSLGATLGELHVALARLPTTSRPGRALFQDFFRFPPSARDPLLLTPAQIDAPNTATTRELLAWWHQEASHLVAFVDGSYRQLPQQLCHNDPAPYNVLVVSGQASAFIDFEFACPAPRGLDIAMALRMTMRIWEQAAPWARVEAFCHGYQRVARLSEAEVTQLPELFRLRGAMGTLWALGRNVPIDPARMVEHLGYLRNAVAWLDQHGSRLTDLVAHHLGA